MPARKKRTDLKVVAGDPQTEVKEKPERRTFTAAYKVRILGELDAAPSGGMAAILRREGLYNSTIQKWRAEAARQKWESRRENRAGRKKNPLTDENRKRFRLAATRICGKEVAMARISTQFVHAEAQPPSAGQVIYRDDDLPGFAVRVTPKAKSFIVEKRVNGVNRRITIGKFPSMSVDDARKVAVRTLASMAAGIDPKTGKGPESSVALREVFEKYLAVRRLKSGTARVYRRLMRCHLSDWLEKPIISITKDMIQERHKQIGSGTAKGTSGKATANNTMRVLRSVINFANEHYGHEDQPLFKINPVSRLSRDRQWHIVHPRRRLVPDNKLAAWYQAIRGLENVVAQDYLLTLLLTGFRKTEALSLTWKDIDFERKMISIPAHSTKTNHAHTVPVCEFLYQLLRTRHHGVESNPFVFPGRKFSTRLTDMRSQLAEIQEKSGVSFSLHDLRRTFITKAEMLDICKGPRIGVLKAQGGCESMYAKEHAVSSLQ